MPHEAVRTITLLPEGPGSPAKCGAILDRNYQREGGHQCVGRVRHELQIKGVAYYLCESCRTFLLRKMHEQQELTKGVA